MKTPTLRYIDGPFGQIHLRQWQPASSPARRTLICLHPAPFSGLAFQHIAPFLAQQRRVIAPDYPGYGGSAPVPEGMPSIGDYADAMEVVLHHALEDSDGIGLIGFHTGCLVAAELCTRALPGLDMSCLIDVPAFPAEKSADMARAFGSEFDVTDMLECLEKPWNSSFKSRLETQSRSSAFAMFVEQLRAGSAMNAAFHAAFSYDWQQRFTQVQVATTVLATQSSLLDGSRAASRIIPGARLLERLDVTRSVLDAHAEVIAADLEALFERMM
ncbi:MAG: alpha/beta hydrolase [Pseudomonadota bacterium]